MINNNLPLIKVIIFGGKVWTRLICILTRSNSLLSIMFLGFSDFVYDQKYSTKYENTNISYEKLYLKDHALKKNTNLFIRGESPSSSRITQQLEAGFYEVNI